mmetsp:Transcript_19530/g.44891  ORF Transcript_19530/g.44891 Transcript_19530/m.44891 type:complete len:258 (+) Transcript_19530:198-971(+)
MWKGFEDLLVNYVNAMLREWARRGKKNDMLRPGDAVLGLQERPSPRVPPWLGEELLHACHRDALMAKLPEHYGQFGWAETGSAYDGSYLWPEEKEDGSWVLRWPKAAKRPEHPIGVGADTLSVAHAADADDTLTARGQRKRRRAEEQATPDRADLVAEWEHLTKAVLPKLASAQRWPIRFDHCFQRVALDAAFEGCWYDHLDRKKGAAIKQITVDDLERAVRAARRMEVEGIAAVRALDDASLRHRGKAPKKRMKTA